MQLSRKKITLIGVGVLLGGIAGYAYYSFVGCNSGSCAITSDPTNSTIYGMVMGGLITDLFNKKKVKDEKDTNS